jgi:hypothetical protein
MRINKIARANSRARREYFLHMIYIVHEKRFNYSMGNLDYEKRPFHLRNSLLGLYNSISQ